MQIEEAIYARLVADSVVSSLVVDRIYPGQAPQSDTFPLVVYQQAYQRKVQTLTGVINLNQYSLRLDIWGETYAVAKKLYHAIRDSLVGFQGELSSGAVTVQGIFEDGGEDGAESPIHDEETGLFTAGIDLAIWYSN